MTEPSLFDALASRDHGAQLAADSVHTSWRLAAEAVIRRLAARGGVFTSDDVNGALRRVDRMRRTEPSGSDAA